MCCPERSFLGITQVHEVAPFLTYLFLPVLEMKAQLHLLSKKGSGALLVLVGLSGTMAVAVVLIKMGT